MVGSGPWWEGSNPEWEQILEASLAAEQFKTDYFKGQTLNKGSFSKVIWVQPRQPGTGASATGLPKAAKLYQRPDNRAKSMWAAEIAMLKALAGNRNIVQVVAVYYTEHALMEPAHCCIVCTHISSSGARLTWRM